MTFCSSQGIRARGSLRPSRAGSRNRQSSVHNPRRSARECSHAAAIVSQPDDGTRRFAGSSERMMGLEPTTFCMARASDVRTGSLPCAQTACLQGVSQSERTRPNPSERRTLPFLPRLGAFPDGREHRRACHRDPLQSRPLPQVTARDRRGRRRDHTPHGQACVHALDQSHRLFTPYRPG